MFEERDFLGFVESSGIADFMKIVGRPSPGEQKALRAYFGENRYERMRDRAIKVIQARGRGVGSGPRGNVVIIPGIAGSKLFSIAENGDHDYIWLNPFRIFEGAMERLRLSADGSAEQDSCYKIRPEGVMKRYYGELILSLGRDWSVDVFAFDWRKSLDVTAGELHAWINARFGENAPVHIVAHSMGGLVARALIKRFPKRWEAMWDPENGARGGRLIMFGTPNHGSFAIPQLFTGLEPLVRKLALLDVHHKLPALLGIYSTFVGSYQMLPSPFKMPAMKPLYQAQTYGNWPVSQAHLDMAQKNHEWLSDAADPQRMVYIAGHNRPTFSNITDMAKIGLIDGYECTYLGDGRVTHTLGLLETPDGKKIPTYFIDEGHAALPENKDVLDALEELLEKGATRKLSDRLEGRRAVEGQADKVRAKNEIVNAQRAVMERLEYLLPSWQGRRGAAAGAPVFSRQERDIEDGLVDGFLGKADILEISRGEQDAHSARHEPPSAGGQRRGPGAPKPEKETSVKISLVCRGIQEVDEIRPGKDPIDAVSVGHYQRVLPEAAEKALDAAISEALQGGLKKAPKKKGKQPKTEMMLKEFTLRGVLRGDLGQTFIFPDPRISEKRSVRSRPDSRRHQRVIAVVGLGPPRGAGIPEVAVAVRELCWILGRLGKRHLATVLIGSGAGNLSAAEAATAWLRGIRRALEGTVDEEGTIQHVTFLENNPAKALEMDRAFVEACRSSSDEADAHTIVKFAYHPMGTRAKAALQRLALRRQTAELKEALRRTESEPEEPAPTRVLLELTQNKFYRFGAVTESAAIPERTDLIDPKLIMAANDELVEIASDDGLKEREKRSRLIKQGLFLERLLIPGELRSRLAGLAPLVLMLDSSTARIHWEMVAQPDPLRALDCDEGSAESESNLLNVDFLGISRGLTRQLRTRFAPMPEPAPPPQRALRVLIVADPAYEDPLPGAQAEGLEVESLMKRFNDVWRERTRNRVDVRSLIGPGEAGRTNVLRELTLNQYDVLHFAGHCVYEKNDPSSSGWLFSGGERLTAHELGCLDRVPSFVFSNACESGITPDRADKRSADLAPSFAEAFFGRGVLNFVCTAWPVDDRAALEFALALYSGLLSLESDEAGKGKRGRGFEPLHMYKAMQNARLKISRTPYGLGTWGAYQHYGSSYFRLFVTRETE